MSRTDKLLLTMPYQFGDIDGVDPDDWNQGYCSIFAYALHLRFGLPMYALLEVAKKDRDATLIHAVALQGETAWDAAGATPAKDLIADYEDMKEWGIYKAYYPGEKSKVVFKKITAQRLHAIHFDFDPHKVYFANRYIDERQDLFSKLLNV